ncbi:MAG: hypothetical protein OSJ58_14325 [Dysosmobacter sp.]|nr:hypothetical protein [Dysosmobacter sp.]
MTDRKIEDADSDAANEAQSWTALPDFQKAYNVYQIMLSDNGISKLKAIAAQCFCYGYDNMELAFKLIYITA